jgi:hypothetical protein
MSGLVKFVLIKFALYIGMVYTMRYFQNRKNA